MAYCPVIVLEDVSYLHDMPVQSGLTAFTTGLDGSSLLSKHLELESDCPSHCFHSSSVKCLFLSFYWLVATGTSQSLVYCCESSVKGAVRNIVQDLQFVVHLAQKQRKFFLAAFPAVLA